MIMATWVICSSCKPFACISCFVFNFKFSIHFNKAAPLLKLLGVFTNLRSKLLHIFSI